MISVMDRPTHWNLLYDTKTSSEVSWYQAAPAASLALIEGAGFGPPTGLIDIGGGDSRLVDSLLDRGARCVTVLDVSRSAVARARSRLGARAADVNWIVSDVTGDWEVPTVDIWHDRAAFHFLIDAADRARYFQRMREAVKPRGVVILATFAPGGPPQCSGLPVRHYDATALSVELGRDFQLLESRHDAHRTPAGSVQPFCFAAFRRVE